MYSNGGKTVVVNMKGWKWSNGESVDANSRNIFLNMAEAEKANWYGYSPGLLPDNLVSYKATGTDQVTFQLNRAYPTIWFTYNQLGELKPMPESWDVTSLTGKPGSGGCTTDSAADGWARCKAVFTFLTAQAKNANTYATSPLWSVVDGPWKLSSFSTTGNVTIVPNTKYSGSPKPSCRRSSSCRTPPTRPSTPHSRPGSSTSATSHRRTCRRSLELRPAGHQPGGQRLHAAAVLLFRPLLRPAQLQQPDGGLHGPPALRPAGPAGGLRPARHHQGDLPRVGIPASGPAPNSPPGNQWIPPIENENNGQGPYPFSIAKAKSTLEAHGWSEVGGVMTCQDPSKCGTGITKGQKLALTYVYSTGVAATTAMWQTYKSDASEAGIDINLVGQTFNTIVGEAAPCSPMSSKCAVQVFAYGGWAFDGPGFEPTGEPLFATGAGPQRLQLLRPDDGQPDHRHAHQQCHVGV